MLMTGEAACVLNEPSTFGLMSHETPAGGGGDGVIFHRDHNHNAISPFRWIISDSCKGKRR